jgi:hypothetical protein
MPPYYSMMGEPSIDLSSPPQLSRAGRPSAMNVPGQYSAMSRLPAAATSPSYHPSMPSTIMNVSGYPPIGGPFTTMNTPQYPSIGGPSTLMSASSFSPAMSRTATGMVAMNEASSMGAPGFYPVMGGNANMKTEAPSSAAMAAIARATLSPNTPPLQRQPEIGTNKVIQRHIDFTARKNDVSDTNLRPIYESQ